MRLSLAAVLILSAGALPALAEIPPIERFSVEKMDRSADPGTDFYQYANGGWMKANEIPADQVTWGPSTALIERNWALLREILDRCQAERPDRTPVERQVGDFYAAAMDAEKVDGLAFRPLQPDLDRIAALASKKEIAALLGDFHERGIGGLFEAAVQPDERHSTTYALELTQGGLGLPDRDYYFSKQFAKERAAYGTHQHRMHELLGTPAAQIAGEINAATGLETDLARVSRKLEDLTDPVANYHAVSLAELEKLTPSFSWRKYLTAAHAAPLETVVVGQPEFFTGLEKALRQHSLEDWKSYLRWHLLTAGAPLLNRAAEAESFAFHGTVLNGQPQIDSRWKRSIRWVDSSLGEALGQLYTAKYFPPAARVRMEAMVANLQAVYREHLAKVPWMSEGTRKEAVAKFGRFTAKLGAPKTFRDYSAVEIRRDDLLGNMQRAEIFESRREMARIGQPVDRTEWGMTPPTVNAYFNPSMNEIVFPAGILQPPFFDLEMDDAVNYGATGATIGHEMTHGFDNEGRKFDAEGNLRDWWTKGDAREFESRAQKLVKQFNAFQPLPGLHVNGKLTLAENIADLGGLVIAYEALERALGSNPEKRKPIDGLTPEQRFFISYAQSWVSKERPEFLRRSVTTDVHAPEHFRAYAPLLNMQEFYDAFGIKKGAPLWRVKELRAAIW